MLSHAIMPWTGAAYRHISARANPDVLDFGFVGLNTDNRWNTAAEPSLYLAGDPGVIIAEWGAISGTAVPRVSAKRPSSALSFD
jgi:RES domain-containing protein